MTSNQPHSSNPPFRTPQPAELQSEESREAVLQRVSEEQHEESDAIDPSEERESAAADAVSPLEDVDGIANRHIPRIDNPPG